MKYFDKLQWKETHESLSLGLMMRYSEQKNSPSVSWACSPDPSIAAA